MIKIQLLTIVLNKNSVRLATCPGIGDNSVEISYLCKDKHENSDDKYRNENFDGKRQRLEDVLFNRVQCRRTIV